MIKNKTKPAIKTGKYKEVFRAEQLRGDLVHLGIYENDVLYVKPVSVFCEEKLYVWETPDGKSARYAFDNFGDISLDDKKGGIIRYKAADLTLLGRVIKIERCLEALPNNSAVSAKTIIVQLENNLIKLEKSWRKFLDKFDRLSPQAQQKIIDGIDHTRYTTSKRFIDGYEVDDVVKEITRKLKQALVKRHKQGGAK